jgi:hypothetical protein
MKRKILKFNNPLPMIPDQFFSSKLLKKIFSATHYITDITGQRKALQPISGRSFDALNKKEPYEQ